MTVIVGRHSRTLQGKKKLRKSDLCGNTPEVRQNFAFGQALPQAVIGIDKAYESCHEPKNPDNVGYALLFFCVE